MPIKNLSNARRMPRLGKIHLGVKKTEKKDGTPCQPYPSEVEYFVCPPEVQAVFGEKPTSLRIMFPVEDAEKFFPQFYKRYTVNLLQCKGDGEKAQCWAEDGSGLKEVPCPCAYLDSGECKQIGIIQFLLPDVPGFGVYQITTSSKNSIIDINSGIDMVRNVCGRIRMIPLILKREKMEIQRIESGKPKKSSHYTLKIALDEKATLRQLQESAQIKPEMILLPPPDESKDELFFPKNGFKPEEEAVEVEPEKPKEENSTVKPDEEERHIDDLRLSLAGKIAQLENLGGKVGPKQKARANELVKLGRADELIKAIDFFNERIDKTEAKQAEKEGEIPF